MNACLRVQDIEVRVQNIERLLRLADASLVGALEGPKGIDLECLHDGRVLVEVCLELLPPIFHHLQTLQKKETVA